MLLNMLEEVDDRSACTGRRSALKVKSGGGTQSKKEVPNPGVERMASFENRTTKVRDLEENGVFVSECSIRMDLSECNAYLIYRL